MFNYKSELAAVHLKADLISYTRKLKKAISDKIATAKLKSTISKITKATIKDVARIDAKGSRIDKEVVRCVNDYMKDVAKLLKKICYAKTTKGFNIIMYKINEEKEILEMRFNLHVPNPVFFTDSKYLSDVLDRILRTREQFEDVLSDRFNNLAKNERGN